MVQQVFVPALDDSVRPGLILRVDYIPLAVHGDAVLRKEIAAVAVAGGRVIKPQHHVSVVLLRQGEIPHHSGHLCGVPCRGQGRVVIIEFNVRVIYAGGLVGSGTDLNVEGLIFILGSLHLNRVCAGNKRVRQLHSRVGVGVTGVKEILFAEHLMGQHVAVGVGKLAHLKAQRAALSFFIEINLKALALVFGQVDQVGVGHPAGGIVPGQILPAPARDGVGVGAVALQVAVFFHLDVGIGITIDVVVRGQRREQRRCQRQQHHRGQKNR